MGCCRRSLLLRLLPVDSSPLICTWHEKDAASVSVSVLLLIIVLVDDMNEKEEAKMMWRRALGRGGPWMEWRRFS